MPMNERQVGGGPATGLANDFIRFFQEGLNSGSFGGVTSGQRFGGADPAGNTQGIAGIINDIISGGAGKLGGSLQEIIHRDTERGADEIRSRFGSSGGMAFGTPGMRAESMFRAEAAPKATQAIGGMQTALLSQLLPIFANLSGKGISQRETVMEQNPWVQGISTLAQLAPIAAAPFTGGASLMALPATTAAANSFTGAGLGAATRDVFGSSSSNFSFDPRLLQMFAR